MFPNSKQLVKKKNPFLSKRAAPPPPPPPPPSFQVFLDLCATGTQGRKEGREGREGGKEGREGGAGGRVDLCQMSKASGQLMK